jgi:hypothetical protein
MPKSNSAGRPRLAPGPKGKRSPSLTLRLPRPVLAALKKRARAEKRPLAELVREKLEDPAP